MRRDIWVTVGDLGKDIIYAVQSAVKYKVSNGDKNRLGFRDKYLPTVTRHKKESRLGH